jgi:prepilin-type N-terminal cleavage/methylation domain-containing protein
MDHSATQQANSTRAFTLIELSIALVIIGLIVGGVMVGGDLINAAQLRGQLSQLEQIETAAIAFKAKYGALPGDIPNADQFGFQPRAGSTGRGDNNGVINGYCYGCVVSTQTNAWSLGGETVLFWRDLSEAGLIPEKVPSATDGDYNATKAQVGLYFPSGKLTSINALLLYSDSYYGGVKGVTWLGLAGMNGNFAPGNIGSITPVISVANAYAIDSKSDDGLPRSGKIRAFFASTTTGWGSTFLTGQGIGWFNTAATSNSSTCFETTTNKYSIDIDNGRNPNCALSYQMKF